LELVELVVLQQPLKLVGMDYLHPSMEQLPLGAGAVEPLTAPTQLLSEETEDLVVEVDRQLLIQLLPAERTSEPVSEILVD
jgi:hypothetical protein